MSDIEYDPDGFTLTVTLSIRGPWSRAAEKRVDDFLLSAAARDAGILSVEDAS